MSSLAGTAALVRLALRRDRIILPVFIVIFVASIAASAYATVELYPDRRLAHAGCRGHQQHDIHARDVRPHPRRDVDRRAVHVQDGHDGGGGGGGSCPASRRQTHALRGRDGPPRAARRDGRGTACTPDGRAARSRRRQPRDGRGRDAGGDRGRDADGRLHRHGRGFRLSGRRLCGRGRLHRTVDEERSYRLRVGRCRPRGLLPAAGDRRCLGRQRLRLGVVAVSGRLVAADPAVRRRQVVGPRSPARSRSRRVCAGLRARGAA